MVRSSILRWVGTLGLVLVWGAVAQAQDVLIERYGKGVHEFHAGRYMEAICELTSAVDGGTRDPRAFYFRGLANLRMGMEDAALEDFDRGAMLEVADSSGQYSVGRALERVQGSERMLLEKRRVKARSQAQMMRQMNQKNRFEQQRRNEAEVLRTPAPLTAPQPPAPAGAAPVAPPVKPTAPAVPAPSAAPEVPADENPFGDDAIPATPPAETPAADDNLFDFNSGK